MGSLDGSDHQVIFDQRDQYELVDDDQSDLNDWCRYNQSQDGSGANAPAVHLTGVPQSDRLDRAAQVIAGTPDVHVMSKEISALKEFMSDQDRTIKDLESSLNAQIVSVQSDLSDNLNKIDAFKISVVKRIKN